MEMKIRDAGTFVFGLLTVIFGCSAFVSATMDFSVGWLDVVAFKLGYVMAPYEPPYRWPNYALLTLIFFGVTMGFRRLREIRDAMVRKHDLPIVKFGKPD
jgi:hypothetical protein